MKDEKVQNITLNPVILDPEEIGKELHMAGVEQGEWIKGLVEMAGAIIAPRGLYRASYVEERSPEGVSIDGTFFTSRILRKNLEGVERVFPYVLTIGDQLERLADSSTDLLEKYCLDGIGNVALVKARENLEKVLRFRYGLDGLSIMSPGTLQDWLLEEQVPLFSILGNGDSSMPVTLSEHLLMVPKKSLSGIYFPTEIPFFSCLLCPRRRCPERKAAYDAKRAREYDLPRRRGKESGGHGSHECQGSRAR